MTHVPPDDGSRFAPARPDPFRDALAAALAPTYDLGRELEGGGMSRVFVAVERSLGRTVVVKVLPPDLAAGVNRERFRREIKVAAGLQHPHIVPLLSAGEVASTDADAEGSLYYTMPFIEGESLRAAVLRGARYSPRDVARILHDVVEGLAYAHARGVIHRDIKPGNVLMLGSHALVTDFGVAKALSAAQGRSGTTTVGLAIGTPAYMAPEQLAADPAADHRMDLYAAGLVAYELLRGESPFASASPQATMAAQLTRMPEPLDQCCPGVPPELSAVIMRCLEKAPDDRWPSADAMLAALDGALTPVTRPLGVQHGGRASAVPPADGARSRRGPLLLAGAVLAAVTAGAALMATRGGDEPPRPIAVSPADSARSVSVAVPPPAAAQPAPTTATPAAPAPQPAAAPRRAPAAPRPRELTSAESLSIAEAVQKRLDQTRRERGVGDVPTMRELEQLRTTVHRQLSDSARRALAAAGRVIMVPDVRTMNERFRVRTEIGGPGGAAGAAAGAAGASGGSGPTSTTSDPRIAALVARISAGVAEPAAGVRRVAVMEFADATGRRDMRDAVRLASAAVRRAVGERRGYELADAGATRDASRLIGAPEPVGEATRSGAVVFGTVFVQRDSMVILAQLFDARRGYPFKSVTEKLPVDSDPATALQAFAERTAAALDGVAWTGPPRRGQARPLPPTAPKPPAPVP